MLSRVSDARCSLSLRVLPFRPSPVSLSRRLHFPGSRNLGMACLLLWAFPLFPLSVILAPNILQIFSFFKIRTGLQKSELNLIVF